MKEKKFYLVKCHTIMADLSDRPYSEVSLLARVLGTSPEAREYGFSVQWMDDVDHKDPDPYKVDKNIMNGIVLHAPHVLHDATLLNEFCQAEQGSISGISSTGLYLMPRKKFYSWDDVIEILIRGAEANIETLASDGVAIGDELDYTYWKKAYNILTSYADEYGIDY